MDMRKPLLPLVLLAAMTAQAQTAPAPPATAPPPPGIDAEGTAAVEVAPAEAAATDPADIKENPLPEKVRPSDELAPNVTIRTEGDVTIEEYRRSGQVYMVVVTPQKGPRYTYLDTDGDGRLEGDPKEGPVQPVYYTLYEWE